MNLRPISHHASRIFLALLGLCSLALAIPALAQQPGTSPVKIFIMIGQSNTEGQGEMYPVTTQGTLGFITAAANDPTGKYQFLKNPDESWAQRDDVWIHYERSNYARTTNTLYKGNLTAGYGVSITTIGNTFQFTILVAF